MSPSSRFRLEQLLTISQIMQSKIAITAALLLAITQIRAVQVTFKRFSQAGCNETYHISADTHLDDPNCKSFDLDEPAFDSYQVIFESAGHGMDYHKDYCNAVVFSQPDCKGDGTSSGDFEYLLDQGLFCNNQVVGRSVKILCEKRDAFPVTSTVHDHWSVSTVASATTAQAGEPTSTCIWCHD